MRVRSKLPHLRRVALLMMLFVGSTASAHTRSESHSVWEIKGEEVDLVMTIPDAEADRLANDKARSDDQMKDYLNARVYPIAGGRRCAAVPPVQTLSAAAGFRKYRLYVQVRHAERPADPLDGLLRFGAQPHEFRAGAKRADRGIHRAIDHHRTPDGGCDRRRREPLKSARFIEFMRMGIMHIFTGVDHMSFLLGAGADIAAPARSGVRGHGIHHRPQPDAGAGGHRGVAPARGIHRRPGGSHHRTDRRGEHRRADPENPCSVALASEASGLHGLAAMYWIAAGCPACCFSARVCSPPTTS